MTSFRMIQLATALAVASLAAACSTWDSMSHTQQGTTVGAAGGAVAGAVVGGPVGAVVGGVAGGAVGHEGAKDQYGSNAQATNNTPPSSAASYDTQSNKPSDRRDASNTATAASEQSASTESTTSAMNSEPQGSRANANATTGAATSSGDTIRAAQEALNDRGYNAGPVDGVMGPKTEAALRKFQSSSGIPSTGRLDSATVAALHLSTKSAAR